MAQQATHRSGTADSAPEALVRATPAPPQAGEAELLREARDAQEQAAHWERLFNAITDPIGVVSEDSRLTYANAAYRALFDREPDGVRGHECFSVHPNPSGGPCETCPVPAAIRSRRPAFVQSERPAARAASEENAGEAEQSTRRVFQRWTYPVIAPDGSVAEVVEMIKDVTEQERLRAVSRQAEALRVADRLKAELLGTVSHELRSPLAAIKGYAGTLLRHDGRLPRAERHEFLTAISEASDRLETIIDQLLLMSQLETGLITLYRAPVDLRQLAREAVTGIERRLPHDDHGDGRDPRARHHVVIVDQTDGTIQSGGHGGDETPLVVAGDRRLLRQALDEVLENAVKYSPDGGRIEVTLGRRRPPVPGAPGDATMLALNVRDEGRGIPAEQLGHVFERFHRGDAGLTSAFGGLGLGLAICKRVIALHGGEVRVESEPGKGTELCLLLPENNAPDGSEGDPATLSDRAGWDARSAPQAASAE